VDVLGEGHEQVVFCSDPESGLRAIIAIHSTAVGPALGGTLLVNAGYPGLGIGVAGFGAVAALFFWRIRVAR